MAQVAQQFRRVKGHASMPVHIAVLETTQTAHDTINTARKAA
jgi:hypothetical protein